MVSVQGFRAVYIRGLRQIGSYTSHGKSSPQGSVSLPFNSFFKLRLQSAPTDTAWASTTLFGSARETGAPIVDRQVCALRRNHEFGPRY
jgi:hypothetical protein